MLRSLYSAYLYLESCFHIFFPRDGNQAYLEYLARNPQDESGEIPPEVQAYLDELFENS